MGRNRQIASADSKACARIREHLGQRSIVMIGLMGAGKTSVGRRLADALRLPFVDADTEIENAAGMTIPEIFADHGEAYFRTGERRVIARLLGSGPQVLATGGGAMMDEETRANVAEQGISVWLRADLPLLVKRVSRRSNRPLLYGRDPKEVMSALIAERHPVYETADIIVESREEPHDVIVADVVDALTRAADCR